MLETAWESRWLPDLKREKEFISDKRIKVRMIFIFI